MKRIELDEWAAQAKPTREQLAEGRRLAVPIVALGRAADASQLTTDRVEFSAGPEKHLLVLPEFWIPRQIVGIAQYDEGTPERVVRSEKGKTKTPFIISQLSILLSRDGWGERQLDSRVTGMSPEWTNTPEKYVEERLRYMYDFDIVAHPIAVIKVPKKLQKRTPS